MANKSYKQLYEETKGMLDKYQNEVVPKLREQLAAQQQPQSQENVTEEELFALKAVAYGCNTNKRLIGGISSFLDRNTSKTMDYVKALTTVYALIERLEDNV